MSYSAIIQLQEDEETYLTLITSEQDYAYDMVIESIFNLLAILSMGNHKFDGAVINRLKFRVEELRDK